MNDVYVPVLLIVLCAGCGDAEGQAGTGDTSTNEAKPDAGASRTTDTGTPDNWALTRDQRVDDSSSARAAQDTGTGDTGASSDGAWAGNVGSEGGGSTPRGSTHEPTGMSVQIDTGPITALPPAHFTMFSPVVITSTGESSRNLILVPGGTGLRLLYNPTLEGGNSPVRFGTGVASPGSTTYYQRWHVRTVPNWAGPRNGNGVKMCEPRAINGGPGSGAGTNDILMMWPNGGQYNQMSAMEGLQGPDGHFRDMGVNQGLIASITDGNWHTDERIYVAESTPGAGDGQYYAYLDGVLVAKYTDVLWLAPGDTWGINYWMVDPTFGGAAASTHPLAGDFWDFNQLYVSTK
jgi:hypothetical protein